MIVLTLKMHSWLSDVIIAYNLVINSSKMILNIGVVYVSFVHSQRYFALVNDYS